MRGAGVFYRGDITGAPEDGAIGKGNYFGSEPHRGVADGEGVLERLLRAGIQYLPNALENLRRLIRGCHVAYEAADELGPWAEQEPGICWRDLEISPIAIEHQNDIPHCAEHHAKLGGFSRKLLALARRVG